MKNVIKTPNPTFEQIQRMVDNLHEKHRCHVSIEMDHYKYKDGETETTFRIYVKAAWSKNAESWQSLQEAYEKLMKE